MRRTFDELWIVDLGGDNLGTRKTPNVFNIQTPVAIAIGVRAAKRSADKPAKVRYAKIDGTTRESKLQQLEKIDDFAGIDWHDCPDDWNKPFLPTGKGDFFQWSPLSDLFPYQRSGSKFGRSWPIAETAELIQRRWDKMLAETGESRAKHFKNNKYRKIERQYRDHLSGVSLPALESLTTGSSVPKITQYAFRSYDRHFAIEDIRFNDRMGEVLWRIQGASQIYFTTMNTEVLGSGQAIISSSSVPDIHHFCGRGGKDVIPLYRDAAATEPNVTAGLLDALGKEYGTAPSAEDFAAYAYALLGGQSYTKRFWSELETPGPRVPITKDVTFFAEAAKLGRKLIWLHTYAARFHDTNHADEVPNGKATTIKGVSSDPAHYPAEYDFDPAKRQISVGDGLFGPIAPEIWEFEVSGLKVVQSWLGYRMKKRAGKKSSPLDEIRPDRWTARMSDEFLELLWVLEATLSMEPELEKVLDKIVAGPCFIATELPIPTPKEREAPGTVSAAGGLLGLMGVEEDPEYEDADDE